MSQFVTDIRSIRQTPDATLARIAVDARVDDATSARTE